MQLIQNLLIRMVLQPLNRGMNKLSWKMRDLMFLTGGLGIVVHHGIRNMGLVDYRFLIFFAVDCLFLGMMILGGMGQTVKPVKWNKFLMICWYTVGLMMFQSGVLKNMDYLPEAMLFLVAYPVLYICWANGDRERIMGLLLKLCRISGWLFVIASFLLAPISASRYAGVFTNTNMASYFLAVLYVGVGLNILEAKLSWKVLPDVILLGMIAALNYYTNSRTGVLAVMLGAGCGVILYVLGHSMKENMHCAVKLIACAVASSVCVWGLVFVFQMRDHIPFPYFDIRTGTLYMSERFENWGKEDPTDATQPSSGEELETEDATQPTEQEELTEEEFFDISGFQELSEKKNSTEGKTADGFLTGRLSLWIAYAQKLNLFGHETTEPVYVPMLYREIYSAHMTILQIGYESGILAGIAYLLFNLGTGVISIAYGWKHRKEAYGAVPLVFTVVFGVLSMLGSCGVSFWYMTTFYYYVVQFPLIARTEEAGQ